MNFLKLSVLVFITVGLTACGGGSGKSGGSSSKPAERPAGTVLGVAHDGPIQNGKITAYQYTNKGKGELLASGMTDEIGNYSLSIKSTNTPVFLEVTGGSYTEEASGRRVTLSDGQKLTAITFYESGAPVNLQLTQYTTWAQCYADFLIEQGATVGNAIVDATETFGNIAGLPIVGTRPIDITDQKNFSAYLTPGLRYGYLLAGISGLTQDLANANNVEAHSSEQYTSIYFTSVVCADIRFDGKMNGIAASTEGNAKGQLYIGKTPLTADHYRTIIAQNILEVAANPEINKAGIKPAELLSFANNISFNANDVFAGAPARAVDIEGPTITPGLASNALVSGQTIVPVTAVDPLGVATVEFYLDDIFLQNGVISDLKATIITQNFPEGTHNLKIVATDVLGNKSELNLPLMFVNTGAALTITSPTLTNSTTYVVSGSYAEGAASVKRIIVKDTEAKLDTVNKTWNATITLAPGINNLIATIYDQFDNSATATANVAVDLIPPSIFVDTTTALFTTYQGQYNLCTHGDLDDAIGKNTPVCLNAENISLNGREITSTMTGNGFVLLGATVSDAFGTGVFTGVGELVVEYKYERAGKTIVDWTPAPRQTTVLPTGVQITNEIYLPLVTEYLGNEFYITSNQEVHTVTFRVRDLAGNSADRPFDFKLDVLTPVLKVSSASVKNDSIFKVDFGQRSGLNGANAEVAYTITNDTKLPYLVSFDAPAQHSLVHAFDGAQRFNKARVNTQEQWRARFCTGNHCTNYDWPTESDWSAWKEVTELNSTALKSLVTAPKTLGTFTDIVSETTQAPATTAWEDYTGQLCSNIFIHRFDACTKDGCACLQLDGDNGSSPAYKYLQERNAYEVEYAAGYPKNVVTTKSLPYNFGNNLVRLFDKATNQEIFPVGGWFKVPPSSTIEIVNFVKFPSVMNYVDPRVAANDSTVPYSEVFLDKSLTYTLNTAMLMKRTINPGDASQVSDVSVTTATIGDQPLVATLAR